MGVITQESHFEMLEKLPDGNFKIKFPKIKSKSGVTFDEHLADKVAHWKLLDTIVLSGDTVQVDITIPAEIYETRIIGSNISSVGASHIGNVIGMVFNDDRASNYLTTAITGPTTFASGFNPSVAINFAREAVQSSFIVDILNKPNSVTLFKALNGGYITGSSLNIGSVSGWWNSMQKINKISLSQTNVSRVMTTGTTFEVWGR